MKRILLSFLLLISGIVMGQTSQLISFSPSSGPAGTLLTVKGTGLAGTTSLTVGGADAIVVSRRDTSVVAMVMPGTATGIISLGTVSSSSPFTVTAALAPNKQQGNKLVGAGYVGKSRQGGSVCVSADGNTAIVGAIQDNNDWGAAWIYARRNGIWKQQGAKLLGSDYIGEPRQGGSVALSADGNTAIVGAYSDNTSRGAAFVYIRNDSTWTQQGKLVNAGTGSPFYMGSAVSLSADGNTALVMGSVGALVFIRNGIIWTLQANNLLGEGNAAALSADGNTAILGIAGDNNSQGAGLIYVRSGSVWKKQGTKLTGSNHVDASWEGNAVAISADGNTVVMGGPNDNDHQGAAWVYTRSDTTWTQQGQKLVGTGGTTRGSQGSAVSLSADGNMMMLGGFSANGSWIFTRNGGIWEQQGERLSGKDNGGAGGEGSGVSVSADGSTAIAGGFGDNTEVGAAWVYTHVSNNANLAALAISSGILTPAFDSTITAYTADVSNSTAKVTVTPKLADSVATMTVMINGVIAADSLSLNQGINTITIKVTSPDGKKNKTYTITIKRAGPPVITSFTPSFGPVGTLITITGTDLMDAATVAIGGVNAIVVSNTGTKLVAMVMPGATTGVVSLGGSLSSSSFTVTTVLAPNTQQGRKLVGAGNVGTSRQGWSVALSADGNTAIVGAFQDNSNQGAAWIYTRRNGIWKQEGAKLVGVGNIGASGQGESVAISADGNTVIVGGKADNNGKGAAWVYRRTDSTWTQQGKLVNAGAAAPFGMGVGVSLSADGNTALVRGNESAQVFVRNLGIWTLQSNKLLGEGRAAALSADGNTAVLGGAIESGGQGAGWIYTRSGTVWKQQGAKLVGSNHVGTSQEGGAVAISADGNTVVMGGIFDNASQGAVWVYTRSDTTWTQQGQKLVGSGGTARAYQGTAVSVSADGNMILLGGSADNSSRGASWLFTRKGGIWEQQGKRLSGKDNGGAANEGYAASLSADGTTAMAGGFGENGTVGASWVYTYKSSNANLAALAISSGTLSPAFDSTVTAYTVDVSNSTAKVTVTATLADSGAFISGSVLDSFVLAIGNNTIEIKVTSSDSTVIKTYTIKVTRDRGNQVITFDPLANRTYGDADFSLTATGGGSPNAVTYTSSNPLIASVSGSTVKILAAGDVVITAKQAGDIAYYAAADVLQHLIIDKKSVSVNADVISKVYGDADPVLTYTFLPALVGADRFTGALRRVAGEGVGSYGINQNTLALSSNYVLNYTGADLTIGAKTVTVSADAITKVYGDADPVLTYKVLPALVGTDVFTGTLRRVAGEGVGDYAIHQNTLALSANYVLNYTGADLTIGAKTIAVSAAAASKIYGDADPALTYTFSPSLVGGDVFTGAISRVLGEDAGSYAINQNTLALNGNYVLDYTGADLTIDAKTITVIAAAVSKIYGDADPALTYTFSPSLVGGDTFTGELIRIAGENVGGYAINQNTLALSGNYVLNYTGADLTIGAKTLTVTANDKSRMFGVSNPVFTASYAGFVGTDDAGVLTIPVSLTTTANVNSPSGTYPISAGMGAALNYSIRFVDGTLVIIAADQSIQFSALADKLSTDGVFSLNAIATSGLVVSYISSDPSIARIVNGDEVEMLKAGTVTITASQAGNGNYTPAAPVIQQLVIIENPFPVIRIESDKGTRISKGETVILTATGADTFKWDFTNGIISGQDMSVMIVRPSLTTTYTVTGANQYGRTSTQTFTIEVMDDLRVTGATNILTPDGDGINDYWIVQHIDMYPDNEVKVFDRSGRVVYTKKGYTNNWGATLNGVPLAEGTYYYVIDYGNGTGIKKGFITVIRR
jgi:gliding motility-associated-like protein